MTHFASYEHGLKLRLGKYKIRLWPRGWEWSDGMKGRIHLFPWAYWGLRRDK